MVRKSNRCGNKRLRVTKISNCLSFAGAWFRVSIPWAVPFPANASYASSSAKYRHPRYQDGLPRQKGPICRALCAGLSTADKSCIDNSTRCTMTTGKAVSRAQRMLGCQRLYMAEIARAGSHIASTLSALSERAAITDVASDFRNRYGSDDLDVFLELLAQTLENRLRSRAATIVRCFNTDTKRQIEQRK